MVGHTDGAYHYYVCGSCFYRRGHGCGRAVYVPKDLVENKIWELVQDWVSQLVESRSGNLLGQVNSELQRSWIGAGGQKSAINAQRLAQVEKSITALREALEKGIDDIEWVNERLRELRQEGQALRRADVGGSTGEAPKVDTETMQHYAANLPLLLAQATNKEKRLLARAFVSGITSDPEKLEIEVGLTAPLFPSTCGGGGRN